MRYLLISILFICTSVSAEDIFQWTDNNGVTHYSTKKSSNDAKKAELPEIMKGEVQIPKDLLITCGTHGGIDCLSGADADGSVICSDGFKDSSERHVFSCKSTKIDVAEISDPDSNGKITVFLRNKKGALAEGVTVTYISKTGKRVPLEGPETIEGYKVAEYYLPGLYLTEGTLKPEKNQLELKCSNCN